MTATQATFESDATAPPSDALAPGTVLLNGQYRIDRYLASGGFGITYLARDSLDRIVVIKECFPEAICTRTNKTVMARSRAHLSEYQSLVEMFVREARSIAKLDHPNIVRVHQVFEDNETAYMALDHIEGRDLLDWIETGHAPMGPEKIKSLLLTVLDAIATVHRQDMLHRDISPDNILIDKSGAPVLIDFGAAREEASKKSRALSAVLVVKDGYSPQEFYIAGSQQTACSDLYALGATFYHLITGNAPPNSQSRLAAIASHQPDPYQPLAGRVPGFENEFLDAIDFAMNVFPSDRIQSAADWIVRIDADKRRELALAAANDDQQIEQTVMELVTYAKSVPEEPPEPVIVDEPAPAPTEPKPVLVLDDLDDEGDVDEVVPPTDPEPEPDAIEAEFDKPEVADVFALDADADETEAVPELTPELPAAAPQEIEPEIAAKSGNGFPRQIAITVIIWSIIVAIFDGWPAQIGYAAEPLFQHVLDLAPQGVDPPFSQ
ncbi:MAG: serine/threonine-protein kinase [Pseudomonadota bacterium]